MTRLRFLNIVDNFSVLLPEKQVQGLEAMRKDCMPNEKIAKMLDPMLDALLANKTVVKMKKKTWMSLMGMTYYAHIDDKNTTDLHRHINSMCKVVSTKADGFRRNPGRSARERSKSPTRTFDDDWGEDEEDYDYDDNDSDGSDSEDSDSEDDAEEVEEENMSLSLVKEMIEHAGGDMVLLNQVRNVTVDRPVITVDDGRYGSAIITWLMTNYAIAAVYRGSGVLVDHWQRGGFGIQTLREMFTSPVDYYNGIYETVAYTIPEISERYDHLQNFINTKGDVMFPHLSAMSPIDIINAMGSSMENTPPHIRNELRTLVSSLATSDMSPNMGGGGSNALLSLALSSRANLDNPRVMLRYTKLWLHYKPVNFLSACTNLFYNIVPKETVDTIGLYLEVQAKYGANVALAVIRDAIPDRILDNTEELTVYMGTLGSTVVQNLKKMTDSQYTQYIKKVANDQKVQAMIKAVKDGLDLRRVIGYRKLADFSARVMSAFMIFIPSLFSFFVVAGKLIYSIFRLVGLVKKPDENAPRTERTWPQAIGRGILNGLDFINITMLAAQSSLELLAMANVMEGTYRLDEITGTASHYYFYSTVVLQILANSMIRKEFGIQESDQTFSFLYIYNKILVGSGTSSVVSNARIKAFLGAGKSGGRLAYWGISTVGRGMIAGGNNVAGLLKDKATAGYNDYRRRMAIGDWDGAEQTMALAKKVPIFQDLIKVHTYAHI